MPFSLTFPTPSLPTAPFQIVLSHPTLALTLPKRIKVLVAKNGGEHVVELSVKAFFVRMISCEC